MSLKRGGSYDSIREPINGSGTSSVIDPVRIHELIPSRKQSRKICQDLQEVKYAKTWNQSFVVPTQTDHIKLLSSLSSMLSLLLLK
jgi:hypothetical protein